jgi:hypothetical protein
MKTLVALVGMRHRKTEALVASLPNGEPLILKREPLNPYDCNAVQVWARGTHVGYVPMKQNKPLAIAMDAAMLASPDKTDSQWIGKLTVDGSRYPLVEYDDQQGRPPAPKPEDEIG